MAGYVATFSYQAAVSHAPQFSPATYRHFTVTPATGAIGAVIEGIDLAKASDEAIGELERALIDHIALMIRDQDLEPADQVRLARRLGRPLPWPYARKMEGYPEITELHPRNLKTSMPSVAAGIRTHATSNVRRNTRWPTPSPVRPSEETRPSPTSTSPGKRSTKR